MNHKERDPWVGMRIMTAPLTQCSLAERPVHTLNGIFLLFRYQIADLNKHF